MARYVVLEFEDNEDAEHFVGDVFYHYAGEVVGLFAKPTQFCDGGGCTRGRVQPWARGAKFGWWVCRTCKKPTSAGGGEKLMHHVLSQAVNLLPGIKQAPASVMTEGWGALGRG